MHTSRYHSTGELNDEKSKYDIVVLSFGLVTIFTVGKIFVYNLLAPNYLDEESGLLMVHTKLQRRSEYVRNVNTQLPCLRAAL